MEKSIIITLCLIVTLLTTSVVFAMGDGITKAESEDQELIHVDMKAQKHIKNMLTIMLSMIIQALL